MRKPECRSVDYSRIGIVVTEGHPVRKSGSTTFIRSSAGWKYIHKPSKDYRRRVEETTFRNPGISRRTKPLTDRKMDFENSCMTVVLRLIKKYKEACERGKQRQWKNSCWITTK